MAQRTARARGRLDRGEAGRHVQRLLGRVYAKSGARVANVFGAFDTADFTRPAGTSVPRNVARLCQWTWECAAPPRGPNQHANQAGYRVIARTFLQASGLS